MHRTSLLFLLLLVAVPADAAEPGPEAKGLRLTARVSSETDGGRTKHYLVSEFENVGPSALRVHFPERATLGAYPEWRLVRADGRVFAPAPWMGQSTWTEGIQGEVREVPAGGRSRFDAEVDAFCPLVDGKLDCHLPGPLEPGTYEATCAYEKADATVPFGLPLFETRREPIESLWTGTLRSEPVRLVVPAATEPQLRIEVRERVVSGDPLRVDAIVTNPTGEPLSLTGAFVAAAHSKMYGGGSARFGASGTGQSALRPGASFVLRVGPNASTTVPVDLAELSFAATDGTERGLYERIPDGHLFLDVAFVDDAGRRVLSTTGALLAIQPRPATASPSLRLSVEVDGFVKDGDVAVLVRLTNAGSAPVLVPSRLSYPTDFYFALRDEDGGRKPTRTMTRTAATALEDLSDDFRLGPEAVVPEGFAWDGDAFERAPAHRASDFERIEPGASYSRRLQLASVVSGKKLPPGRLSVQAFWRNLDSGRRLGLSEPAFVGRLASEPVVLPGAPR